MADDWTGINIRIVTSQLNTFADKTKNIIHNYSTNFDLFNDTLYETWGSDNAVNFNEHLTSLFKYKKELCEMRNKLLKAVSEAATEMAKHNGATFNYRVDYMMYGGVPKKIREDINGVKGMNIPLAKTALDSFEYGCSETVKSLDELPVELGLYDPSGELEATYKALIKNTVSQFKNDFIDARNYLADAFKEETLQLEIGKKEAEEELAANSTDLADMLAQQ